MDMTALRSALAQLRRGELLIVARRAAEMLPASALPLLLGGFVELPTGSDSTPDTATLLDEVQRFHEESMHGQFYEGFDVNSRNSDEQSSGTDAFIAEFDRLVDRCIVEAQAEPCHAAAQAFEVLFDLLRRIDEGNDDVLFFADEGGSWSVGVDWSRALPAYFQCLAQFASAEHFASCVTRVISDFVQFDSDRYAAQALASATPEQRASLEALAPQLR